jgi:hypothetical protein
VGKPPAKPGFQFRWSKAAAHIPTTQPSVFDQGTSMLSTSSQQNQLNWVVNMSKENYLGKAEGIHSHLFFVV